MIKAHWTYSKQEWKAYLYNSLKRKNFFLRTWKKLLLSFTCKAPEVKITPVSITIGNERREISHAVRVSNIELMNIDEINIMTVSFEIIGAGDKAGKIHIPVPKGKLRDAFELRQNLLDANQACLQGQARW